MRQSLYAAVSLSLLSACSSAATPRRAQDGTAIAASRPSAPDAADATEAGGAATGMVRDDAAGDVGMQDDTAAPPAGTESTATKGGAAPSPAADGEKKFPLTGIWRSSCVNAASRTTRDGKFFHRSEDTLTEIGESTITITVTSWADADCLGESASSQLLDGIYSDYGPSPTLRGAQQFGIRGYSFVGMIKDQKLLFALAGDTPRNFNRISADTKLMELTSASYDALMAP